MSPESQRNPCHETSQKHLLALGMTADDGRIHWFALSQLLDVELDTNFAAESDEFNSERLHLRFASGEALVLGRKLRRLANLIQAGELSHIEPLNKRYEGMSQLGHPLIVSISVTRRPEL